MSPMKLSLSTTTMVTEAEAPRPAVYRTSSAPEALSADSSLFISSEADRPRLPRACSESLAIGVLERRRRKAISENGAAPLTMMLDFAGLPRMMGTGNVALLKAARKAAAEPREWDWGYGEAGPSRQPAETRRQDRGYVHAVQRSRTLQPSRTPVCYGYDSEFEWALGGHNRLSEELYRSEPQDAQEKESEEVYLAMQAKFASHLPEAGRRFRPRLKALRVQSQKLLGHAHKASLQMGKDDAPSPFVGAREHAFGSRRSKSVERGQGVV